MYTIQVRMQEVEGGVVNIPDEQDDLEALVSTIALVHSTGFDIVDIKIMGFSILKVHNLVISYRVLSDAVSEFLSKRLGFAEFKKISYRAMKNFMGE